MADEELKIRLTVQGKEEAKKTAQLVDDIVTKSKALELAFKQGKVSADQAIKGITAYGKELEELGIVSKRTVAGQQSIWHMQNRIGLGFKSLATEVKQANVGITNLAAPMRTTAMAGINMNRVLQDMPYGMQGVANNIEPLIQSMRAVRVEMDATGRSGSALKVVLMSMLTPSGLLIAAGGLIPLAMIMMPKLTEMLGMARFQAEALKSALSEAFSSPLLKDMGPEARRRMLEGSKERLKGLEGLESSMPFGSGLLLDAASKVLGINIKNYEQFKKQLEVEKVITEELERQVKLDEARAAIRARLGIGITLDEETVTGRAGAAGKSGRIGGIGVNPYMDYTSSGEYSVRSIGMSTLTSQFGRIGSTGVTAPRLAKPKPLSWSKADPKTMMTTVDKGIVSMGNTLANSLAQGFQIGFRAGEDMLQSFTTSVLAAIGAIAAQQAAIAGISGILSLIPGVGSFGAIAGALGGIFGGGGSTQSIGEIGRTGGNPVIGELQGVRRAVEGLELRVDNMGVYMSSERGRIAFERS